MFSNDWTMTYDVEKWNVRYILCRKMMSMMQYSSIWLWGRNVELCSEAYLLCTKWFVGFLRWNIMCAGKTSNFVESGVQKVNVGLLKEFLKEDTMVVTSSKILSSTIL